MLTRENIQWLIFSLRINRIPRLLLLLLRQQPGLFRGFEL